MSEAPTNPETGVVDQQTAAPTDADIDTEAFDREEAPGELDPDVAVVVAEGDDDQDKPKPDQEPELVEIDVDGQKHKVPAALKDSILRHADYTAKTTAVAEERRALTEERQTWESQREQSRAALPEEHKRVALLEHSLAEVEAQMDAPLNDAGASLRNIDWDAYRRSIDGTPADDPARVTYTKLLDAYMGARDRRIFLTDQAEAAKTELQTKEAERLTTQQEADQANLAKQRQETGRVLAAEIPGWNPKVAEEIILFGVEACGLRPEEAAEMVDPRIWKLIHRLKAAEGKVSAFEKTQTQQQKADTHAKAQTTTPAVTTKGSAPNTRDPSKASGDGLGTPTWMVKRNAQVAARNRAR